MDPLGQTRCDPPDLPDELQRQLLAWFAAELTPAARERALAALQAERPEWAEALRRVFDQLLADRPQRDASPDDPSPPSRIGPYRITATLGQGGMGIVYAAERTDPIHQRVALKVVKRGMATREVLSRFALERRTLAAMNHPAIARVFDAGETDRGEPWLVMELVAGLPVDEHRDRHRLDLAERLELFQRICAGVQHAHQRGVIHRDLKPGNVLVHQEGDEHLPKILDFGLAKATDQDLLDSTVNTRIDQILGTPEYMAPEQATGDAEAIDTRADVYSLGVILYQLLTGELPFPSAELRRAGLLGALRMIREQDPPKPSTRLSSKPDSASRQAARSRTPLPHLTRALKGDLDWVVLRALAKEPARRYESAAGLAADLRRFLNHEPLEAGPPSAGYRLGKLLRRYRVQAIGLTAVFVTAIVGAAVAISYAREALEQSRRAGENLERFKARTEEFDQLAAAVHVERLEMMVADPPPAWPPHLETYEQAFAGLERLAELEEPIATTLQQLRDRSTADADGERQFAAEHDRFLFETLTRVQASSRFLRQSEEVARSRDHDLVWVRHLAEREAGDSWRRAWTEAGRVLAVSPRYADADVGTLRPQHGLLPLGENPATGLLEFYHLRSAWDGTSDPAELPIPRHDERTGHIEVTPDTGIVFVLLPGGRCTLGAQGIDPAAPNYDPFAPHRNPRAPVNEVEIRDAEVAPFFLARHELTQAQWRRLVFGNLPPGPSIPDDRPIQPVNHVTWEWCVALLARYRLALPSETQWEYACRAGTSTPWWPGRDQGLLADVVRVGDVGDVGSLRANPFGLHDVHGNVWEWCTDAYAEGLTRFVPAGPAAALGLGPAPYRALRGGGRYDPSYLGSRAACVDFETANTAATDGGCRPMRPLLD